MAVARWQECDSFNWLRTECVLQLIRSNVNDLLQTCVRVVIMRIRHCCCCHMCAAKEFVKLWRRRRSFTAMVWKLRNRFPSPFPGPSQLSWSLTVGSFFILLCDVSVCPREVTPFFFCVGFSARGWLPNVCDSVWIRRGCGNYFPCDSVGWKIDYNDGTPSAAGCVSTNLTIFRQLLISSLVFFSTLIAVRRSSFRFH